MDIRIGQVFRSGQQFRLIQICSPSRVKTGYSRLHTAVFQCIMH